MFLRVQLTIVHHWFRWWLGADQATSHYLNQWWLDYWRIYASPGLNELSARDRYVLKISFILINTCVGHGDNKCYLLPIMQKHSKLHLIIIKYQVIGPKYSQPASHMLDSIGYIGAPVVIVVRIYATAWGFIGDSCEIGSPTSAKYVGGNVFCEILKQYFSKR